MSPKSAKHVVCAQLLIKIRKKSRYSLQRRANWMRLRRSIFFCRCSAITEKMLKYSHFANSKHLLRLPGYQKKQLRQHLPKFFLWLRISVRGLKRRYSCLPVDDFEFSSEFFSRFVSWLPFSFCLAAPMLCPNIRGQKTRMAREIRVLKSGLERFL